MSMLTVQRYFIYSALLHGLFVLIMALLNRHALPPRVSPQTVSLELIEPVAEKKENADKAKDDEKKLIVDQDKINDEIDPLAKYLSSHNQKVFKETVAQNHGDFQNKKVLSKPRQEVISQPSKPKTKTLPKDLFGSYKDSLAKNLERQQQNKGEQAPGADVSQTRDYLPGKEAGLETLLSTKEFVYYTYYNRIRNQLSQYWEPKIKQKIVALFKQGRRIASTEDRITKVLITLDSKGLLVKVQVLGASGVQDLDDVAVEAFKAAAPFPNPPKGIIEADGTVKIQWDFVIET